jgi:hypothetical protein
MNHHKRGKRTHDDVKETLPLSLGAVDPMDGFDWASFVPLAHAISLGP